MTRESTILWTEITDFPKGWGIKKHFHKNYFHLFYFVKGTGVFLIDEEKYDITPGICFLLPPGIIHGLETSMVDELVSYEIKFTITDPYLLEQITKEFILTDGGDFLRECVEFIQKNGLSHKPDKMKSTNHFMCALLTTITEKYSNTEQKESELIDTTDFSPTVIGIITYIESNYMHHIYLNDIAEYIEYNRNYMCSIFKKETNVTVVDYLNYVRIRKACEYILYSDIGFSQICYRVGFLNLSHFNRTFKKLVGATPSTYSKMVNVDDNNLFPKSNDDPSGAQSLFPSLDKALAALKVGTSS